MSPRPALAALAVAALLGACGDDTPDRPPAPVRVAIEAPADTAVVSDESVTLRGTVRPSGAEVRVLGREADKDGRAWSAEVELEPGGNVIDVTATMRDRAPAVTAVRVVRQVPVRVPQVRCSTVQDARDELAALGLEVRVEPRGGLLDDLLPGEDGVCGTQPGAGKTVRPGSSVVLEVAKVC